jgi:hypothetical protein
MIHRNIFRDLVVYLITSARYLLLKGRFLLFVKDLRAFFEWRKYRISTKGTLDYKIPWLVFSCIQFLEKWLKKEMLVFEYGSGGSTLFFAEKTASVFSVEHDQSWYYNAKKAMEHSGLLNIQYSLFEPETDVHFDSKDPGDPTHYISGFDEYKKKQFEKYAKAIDSFPDEHFDLVVVDGRVRSSCILHAIKKVKINGALLVDNADRKQYLLPFPELNDSKKWEQKDFTGHFPYGPASVLNTTKVFIKKN